MTEAETFVKEVTTHGDKGVVNYIKSCEMNNSYYCLFDFYVCCGICLFMCIVLFVCKYVSLLFTLIETSLKLEVQTLYWIKQLKCPRNRLNINCVRKMKLMIHPLIEMVSFHTGIP